MVKQPAVCYTVKVYRYAAVCHVTLAHGGAFANYAPAAAAQTKGDTNVGNFKTGAVRRSRGFCRTPPVGQLYAKPGLGKGKTELETRDRGTAGPCGPDHRQHEYFDHADGPRRFVICAARPGVQL
ncbi:hypothetical protein SDC9_190938 [bioreactor metagenome]|uniref:Uncharacterized protein n=1 Tax=bioreactor metagenome TaxID=1076179 RepID=A0A645HYW1_9ZZZZ